ncbi:MAG: hypothetical protein KGI97_08355, partial [Alphaproteobacteria bacterium]|nr:hypothetical protein [Alphaproteobacteria bacterium]
GFQYNFLSTVDAVFHESQHVDQYDLVERYNRGQIARTNPNYFAARIFAANLNNFGYISPFDGAPLPAYENQPAEIDARYAGATAADAAYHKYVVAPRRPAPLRAANANQTACVA